LRPYGRPSRARGVGAAVGAGVLACTLPAHAQFSGVAGIDNENRYRGLATDDVGAVARLSGMVDAPAGLYAGLSGIWRTHDGHLASADAIAGWSGRGSDLDALQGIDAAWGWDLGVHRRHYGENGAYDFSELMAGVLGPGFNLRVWWSPHYYGQAYPSWYFDLNTWHELDQHWRVFAHVGVLSYRIPAGWPPYETVFTGYTDGLLGVSWSSGPWELRVARDGLLAGDAPPGLDEHQRAPGWLLSANFAF
jgi:hypothetical protein